MDYGWGESGVPLLETSVIRHLAEVGYLIRGHSVAVHPAAALPQRSIDAILPHALWQVN